MSRNPRKLREPRDGIHMFKNRLASRGSGSVAATAALFDCCGTKQALSHTKWLLAQEQTRPAHSPTRGPAASPALRPARVVCVAESAGV